MGWLTCKTDHLLPKVKGKVRTRTGHASTQVEYMYSSTISSTMVMDGGGWLTPRPSHFTFRESQYQFYRKLGRPQGGCGKSFPPLEFDHQNIQPVDSRYTNYAISAHPLTSIWCQYYKCMYINLYYPLLHTLLFN